MLKEVNRVVYLYYQPPIPRHYLFYPTWEVVNNFSHILFCYTVICYVIWHPYGDSCDDNPKQTTFDSELNKEKLTHPNSSNSYIPWHQKNHDGLWSYTYNTCFHTSKVCHTNMYHARLYNPMVCCIKVFIYYHVFKSFYKQVNVWLTEKNSYYSIPMTSCTDHVTDMDPLKLMLSILSKNNAQENLIYEVKCTLCYTIYIGKTQQITNKRIDVHFSNIQRLLKKLPKWDLYIDHYAWQFQ